jgi:hypothetical protein
MDPKNYFKILYFTNEAPKPQNLNSQNLEAVSVVGDILADNHSQSLLYLLLFGIITSIVGV